MDWYDISESAVSEKKPTMTKRTQGMLHSSYFSRMSTYEMNTLIIAAQKEITMKTR